MPQERSRGSAPDGAIEATPDGAYDPTAPTAESRTGDPDIALLVDRARAGDRDAFAALYDNYHAAVYRYVYYRTPNRQIAEDLTSETFFKALRRINSFTWQGRDFGAWLTTIARNLIVDHAKLACNRLEQPYEITEAQLGCVDSPETKVIGDATRTIIEAKLRELPSEQRECLILRFFESMSIAQTALVMDKTEGAVKQLQLRAVRNLGKAVLPILR